MGALHRTLPWLVLMLGGFALGRLAPDPARAADARAPLPSRAEDARAPLDGARASEALAQAAQGQAPAPGAVRPGAQPAAPAEPARASAPDAFHPDARGAPLPPARDGGRVVVQIPGFPRNLNYLIENSAVTRRMWQELHEPLIRQDPRTWEYVPALAERFAVHDQLVLDGGDLRTGAGVLVGRVEDAGERWRVVPPPAQGTDGATAGEPASVAKTAGQRVLRGTVFDFELRRGVRWQDGAEFDARDVLFTLRCFANPHVPCDEKRYQFGKLARFESAGSHRVRCAFREPYFLATGALAGLPIQPAHLLDLADPRNPAHSPGASDEQAARFLEEHPANRMWIGLGPYRVAAWDDTAIVARRWDGYHDRAAAGHVDEIVWRLLPDAAAVTALLEGELDYFDRLSGEDYFGGRTANATFEAGFYKGYSYGPQLSYVAWNTRREKLADPRVRTALAHCFDWDGFIASYYKGLAQRVTGEQFPDGPAYDKTLAPLAFDLARARALLREAGWADGDGDGTLDRGGVPLRLEFLYSGDRTSELLGQAFQANLKKVGVELALQAREWAAMNKRRAERDFDCVSMGWVTPPVVDPEQVWHSRWAAVPGSENLSGLADAEVDRWIDSIQVELDPARRQAAFASLQRRVYALQPYMFGVNVPRKFAMAKRVRNLECFVLDPGYSIRRWFVVPPPK